MINHVVTLALFVQFLFTFQISETIHAQTANRSDEVIGLIGSVNIIPNEFSTHTTVVFTSNTPVSPTSNQIVFVLQTNNTPVPPAWIGPGRILTGDGFLAVIAADHPGQKYMFKFRDRKIPPSLSKMKFDEYEIIGIARYGEKAPLNAEQIATLASTGTNCSSNQKGSSDGSLVPAPSKSIAQPLNPNPPRLCPQLCTSGGGGASSCSAGGGGCSVTCTSGNYACCNSQTDNCGCCSSGEEYGSSS